MGPKQRLQRQLSSARQLTEGLLATFKTPEQWTHQICASANHALWFVGHMASMDNFFLSLIDPSKVRDLPGYSEKFGVGSRPSSNASDYPAPVEVMTCMRERRQVLLKVLDSLSEDDLSKSTPAGSPEFLPDVASVFETAIWHEGLHSGQVSVVRKALGMPPLMG
jgi:hypothetical protein